jgi:hypothetical protein
MGKIFKQYRIELSKASQAKQAKFGKGKGTRTIKLSNSKDKVVAKYLVPEQYVEKTVTALKRERGS